MTARRSPALATGLLAAALAMGAACAVESSPAPAAATPGSAPAAKPSVSSQAPIRAAQVRQAPAPRAESKPTWAELTPPQQKALAPLSATWRDLGEAHKRKWLALSENYATMPPPEQARLHSRMTEWAALSPQQRTLARLNFAEAQKVAPTDKRAKWEAYQALPPEEKRKLAAGAAAAKKPPPTAIAVEPVPQQKLARIPKKKSEKDAKIAVVPGQGDPHAPLPPPLAPTLP
jgi:hypothetical protein